MFRGLDVAMPLITKIYHISLQYLESVRPVLSEERFKKMEKLAEDFKV